MSIASRIEQIEQHIENAYESIGNKGVDLRDKLNIDLKGNTSQEAIQGEVGLEEEDTSIYVDDVNEDKENYITLKGNTYQDSTEGNQLLTLKNSSFTAHGITKTITNSSVTFSGTPERDWTNTDNISFDKPLTANNSYNISYTGNADIYIWFKNSSYATVNSINLDTTNRNKSFTPTEEIVYYVIGINHMTVGTPVNATVYPMLVSGSTAKVFEPYTNGASPNPDYPQEIEVVTGLNEVEVCGKNLLYYKEKSTVWANATITTKDNTIIYTPDSNGNGGMSHTTYIQNIFIPSGSTLTFSQIYVSGDKWTSGALTNELRLVKKDGTFIKKGFGDIYPGSYQTTKHVTFTTEEDVVGIICYSLMYTVKGMTTPLEYNVQLEMNDNFTSYEPYKGQTYEINLGKNLFDKNNYTILEGYIRDRFDEFVIANGNTNRTIVVKCKPNTTYTVQKTDGNRFSIFTYNSLVTTNGTYNITNYVRGTVDGSPEPPSQTISTGDDEYLYVHLFSDINNVNLEEILATIQIEEGDKATTYAPYFTPIELCKIGTYQDRIYKNNGNWYLHKVINKVVLTGNEEIGIPGTNVGEGLTAFRTAINSTNMYDDYTQAFSNMFRFTARDLGQWNNNEKNTPNTGVIVAFFEHDAFYCRVKSSLASTVAEFRTFLQNNEVVLYIPLTTPIDTQITDTTLISQLNALYNATIYSTTYINTETSNLLPYINLKYNVVTASPSPDRASEVEVVKGNNTIKIQSKNLLSFTRNCDYKW